MSVDFANFRLLLGFCGIIILATGSAMLAHQISLDLASFGPNHVTKNPAALTLLIITVTTVGMIIFKIYSKKLT